MGLTNVSVFQVTDGCMCDGCFKKVRKILLQIDENISINIDKGKEKLTIQGNYNLDSNIIINKLGHIWKNVMLVTEQNPIIDQTKEKQTLVNEASDVVVHTAPSYNQEIVLSTPRFYSKPHHKREFELKQYHKRFRCDGCKEKGYGTRYRCKHCDYELHVDCMKPKPTVSHDLFEGLIFKFSRRKPNCSSFCTVHTKNCEACGKEIRGFSYHSVDKNLYLHPRCVNFTQKLCIQGETFILKNKATHKCFWCNESENKANSGWSYVSEGNKEQLHVNCLAKIVHEAWKERTIGGNDDACIAVINKRLNWGIVDNKKKNRWSKCGKLLKVIMVFARTIISILLGDPTVIFAPMLVEVFK